MSKNSMKTHKVSIRERERERVNSARGVFDFLKIFLNKTFFFRVFFLFNDGQNCKK